MKPLRCISPVLSQTLILLFGIIDLARGQTLQVATLLPTVGPVGGGTTVIIVGAGFQDGATVNFGSLAGQAVTFINANLILATTPAGLSFGTVDVLVTNPDGTGTTLANGFGYACLVGESFNPVALTPESYTHSIVVPASYPAPPANGAVNVTMDGGPNKNGNTWYEVGTDLAAPATGLPPAGTLLTDQARFDHQFLLAPSWGSNNCLFIGNYPSAGLASGSFTLTPPITCSSLSFLNSAGNGPAQLMCIITHADGSAEVSSFTSLDWFNGATAAFSAQGRLSLNGNGSFNRVGSTTGCKLFSTDVAVANTNSPVTQITFSWVSGGRAAIFAVSADSGSGFMPVPLTGYNADAVVETTPLPLPYTATMDNGTNITTGGGNTWYELGWNPLAPETGFPTNGSLISSPFTATPFQLPSRYSAPMATLLDASHPAVNLTPATPLACAAVSLLTSGGAIGVNHTMTSLCVMQHADGTSESNLLVEYDWFQNTVPPVYSAAGRVNFSNGRVLNNVNSPDPVLFETQFPVVNVTSPLTNLLFELQETPGINSTTYIFALSATPAEAPTIECPGNLSIGCSPDFLIPVNFSVSATDNCDANPAITYSVAPGSGFPIGTTTVTATARNSSGVEASCSFTVTRAALAFTGFLPPLGGADASGGSFGSPLRVVKLNSTLPVKFSAGCGGTPLLSGSQRLDVIKYTHAHTHGAALAAVASDTATSGNQFRLTDGQWHFNLDTRETGMSVGTWLLRVTLSDGSQHTAWIQVR